MSKKKGFFISFEGPEASGKSSQILLLQKYLTKKKISFITTREPGGTKLAESLRNLILKIKSDINIEEEILMLMAARSHHINNVIKPALDKGSLVISDRFADSTFVYQGYVNDFGIQKAKNLHKNILNNFLPHKTFLFNLSTSKIIARLKNRKSKIGEMYTPTAQVMESAKASFKQLYRDNVGKELSDAAAQQEVLKVYRLLIG